METNGEAIGKLFLGDAIGVRWTDEVLFCILPDVNRPPTVWGVRAVPYTDSKRYIAVRWTQSVRFKAPRMFWAADGLGCEGRTLHRFQALYTRVNL
jgi:hypothetical protein